ncbi:MAG: D-sedoheptulose 7-phosphate isomerase [Alphaproteobacteria bacterium]|nr:D-sedoheptulose 7-phosphate isomerase [Alphaproteobacteria bacterium]
MTGFDPKSFYQSEFVEHRAVAEATHRALEESFVRLLAQSVATIRNGGKILFCGNGGSASDAQHLATELTVRYIKNRPAIAAIALTTDTSALTAIGNDIGFEYLFSRQVEAIGKQGDLLIGISTSGNSPNVIEAFKIARKMGITSVLFGGKGGGPALKHADIALIVPSNTTGRIQEMHITLGQMLCGGLELALGIADGPATHQSHSS